MLNEEGSEDFEILSSPTTTAKTFRTGKKVELKNEKIRNNLVDPNA